MGHSNWALMWSGDELILVPMSAINWSWFKDTNVPLSPQIKLLLGYRQSKPRAREKKMQMKRRHKPRRALERAAGGANNRRVDSGDDESSTEDFVPHSQAMDRSPVVRARTQRFFLGSVIVRMSCQIQMFQVMRTFRDQLWGTNRQVNNHSVQKHKERYNQTHNRSTQD
ncbi:hypothetical protein SARC_02561 [Sphaeroforma arctica JP610]|uniref:Uncharacterized protein n=1 Tax=Sphaeroforma arctica JP610 TaxID=667725 RepID=A0A0L0G8D8_9EUKA|nr:hypothetical protein SARC_02561 [Sphaeroforma arctica JP610]KNC85265.1 hypothetical protein SARC_02561 [Sphaeroforma arctica JP610]|eukprot:XP_014159167.1 hypothetical protein SARC_02561 [Sphaeroforma arctica JP610]